MIFAIRWHESAMGIHVSLILNPPLSSLPIPSLRVVPVYWLWLPWSYQACVSEDIDNQQKKEHQIINYFLCHQKAQMTHLNYLTFMDFQALVYPTNFHFCLRRLLPFLSWKLTWIPQSIYFYLSMYVHLFKCILIILWVYKTFNI